MFARKTIIKLAALILTFFLAVMVAGGCSKQSPPPTGSSEKLPDVIVWTTYDVGMSTYAETAAVADGIVKKTGLKIRSLPSGNDPGRIIPLRSGTAHFSVITGATAYFVSHGLYDFATYDWGPQPLQLVLSALPAGSASLATAAEANIKTPYDLKGKRVCWVPGSAAINATNEAFLAFAGLNWNDVKKVEVPGGGASYKSLVEGKADATIALSTSPTMYELESSPRGIYWPEFPASDKAGWERMLKIAPYLVPEPVEATIGAGLSKENPRKLLTYPMPVVVTYKNQSENIVYTMIKAINESFELYKNASPAMSAWELKKAVTPKTMILPYHPGAVKYFKEIGLWTKEMEEKQNKLLAEQEKLQKLWEEALSTATSKGLKEKDFVEFWTRQRAAALK